jgi:lysophospholipase L1-like esterase
MSLARASRRRVGYISALTFAALLASALPAASAASAAPPAVPTAVRVMPLGDSITWGVGSSTSSSYRADLWRRLAVNGYGVDFVGSVTSGQLPDPANEGHSGWTIAQIAANINGWLAGAKPDVVLLHIGTNDVNGASAGVGAPDRLNALIDQIRSAAPATTVLVAQIVPSTGAALNARIVEFNSRIPAIVASKNSAKVRLVDQYHALTSADLADSLHPNDAGYVKMAATWYAALAPVLSRGAMMVSALNADRCIDTGANPGNGAVVQLWACHGGSAQTWTRQGETLRAYGLCLEIPGTQTQNGTRLRMWSCNGGANQRWQLRSDATVYNPASGRCVDVPFGDAALGSKLIIWDCHVTANQMWSTR